MMRKPAIQNPPTSHNRIRRHNAESPPPNKKEKKDNVHWGGRLHLKFRNLPVLKEMLANEARVFASWYSLMLFFNDFLLIFSCDGAQHGKQLIFHPYNLIWSNPTFNKISIFLHWHVNVSLWSNARATFYTVHTSALKKSALDVLNPNLGLAKTPRWSCRFRESFPSHMVFFCFVFLQGLSEFGKNMKRLGQIC